MALSPGRITSAGRTAYNQETLVIPLSSKNQPCRRTDGHDDTLQNSHPIAASSSSQPNKPASEQTARPANCQLLVSRAGPSTYPPLLSLKSAAAARPNLHSPNSWPAVQCNEGFCNASEGQRLPLTTAMASQKPHHYPHQGRRSHV